MGQIHNCLCDHGSTSAQLSRTTSRQIKSVKIYSETEVKNIQDLWVVGCSLSSNKQSEDSTEKK